uniref:Cation-transporting ATPase 13A3 n=1 Tax=Heterorhabditis bacteriophora TaxID=37862 RepID=A0A1I7WPP4_HETBA
MNLETLIYPSSLEPQTEDMSTQMCLRDGSIYNVPRLLLVSGDVILLRPSQIAPCTCYTDEGQTVGKGERLSMRVVIDEETDAAVPTDYIKIHYVIHVINERYVLPVVAVTSIIAVSIRFFYANEESLFGTRFVFAVPSLILLPITFPLYPLLIYLTEWCFRIFGITVPYLICFAFLHMMVSLLNLYKLKTIIMMKITLRKQNISFIVLGKPTKDYVSFFGNLTGVSFVDKKGLLSPMNPCLDKVIFFRSDENEIIFNIINNVDDSILIVGVMESLL